MCAVFTRNVQLRNCKKLRPQVRWWELAVLGLFDQEWDFYLPLSKQQSASWSSGCGHFNKLFATCVARWPKTTSIQNFDKWFEGHKHYLEMIFTELGGFDNHGTLVIVEIDESILLLSKVPMLPVDRFLVERNVDLVVAFLLFLMDMHPL